MAEEIFTLKDYHGWIESQLDTGASSSDSDMLPKVSTALQMMYMGIDPIDTHTGEYRTKAAVDNVISTALNEAYITPPEDEDGEVDAGFVQPFKYRQLKQTQITAEATALLVYSFAKKIVISGHKQLHESNKIVPDVYHDHT